MKITYYSLTDKGISRDHNEDYFLNNPKYSIFMVADGMGGYECGDIASKLALKSVQQYLENYTNGNGKFSKHTFTYAIEYANSCIFGHKKKNPDIKNMGTTFVCFAHSENGGMGFNIGDSRIYRFRNRTLTQLTKDHSAEQELPDFMQNANEGKYSSVLTRALGTNETVTADSITFDYKDEDILLLCSDGLYSMVSNESMNDLLGKSNSLKQKCIDLISAANREGGEDNITTTLIQIESSENPSQFETKLSD